MAKDELSFGEFDSDSETVSTESGTVSHSNRKQIFAKLRYGTEVFKADTSCCVCNELAHGLVYDDQSNQEYQSARAMCKKHFRRSVAQRQMDDREIEIDLFVGV